MRRYGAQHQQFLRLTTIFARPKRVNRRVRSADRPVTPAREGCNLALALPRRTPRQVFTWRWRRRPTGCNDAHQGLLHGVIAEMQMAVATGVDAVGLAHAIGAGAQLPDEILSPSSLPPFPPADRRLLC
jgi:hypothetical protein